MSCRTCVATPGIILWALNEPAELDTHMMPGPTFTENPKSMPAMSRTLLAVVLCAPLAFTRAARADALQADALKEEPLAVDPTAGHVGEIVDDVTFSDIDNRPLRTADVRGVRAAVVCFTGVGCPVARKLLPTIAALEKAYRAKGVAFVLVNPNAHEKVEDFRAAARAAGFEGRVVHDPSGAVARALRATSSTEA